HLIEPLHQLVREVITELLVELPRQFGRHRHGAIPLESGDSLRVRSAPTVGNLWRPGASLSLGACGDERGVRDAPRWPGAGLALGARVEIECMAVAGAR